MFSVSFALGGVDEKIKDRDIVGPLGASSRRYFVINML
jgi:hypothetical protein